MYYHRKKTDNICAITEKRQIPCVVMEKRQIEYAITEKKKVCAITKKTPKKNQVACTIKKADNMCYHFLVSFFFKIVRRFCVAHTSHPIYHRHGRIQNY